MQSPDTILQTLLKAKDLDTSHPFLSNLTLQILICNKKCYKIRLGVTTNITELKTLNVGN